ncbi:sulfurtransferase complex subunit TusB [Thalassotalea sp. LPB0316]|uniref:sulfurtransferase complex subunit TusB n=1 Tax=Thalassotalea sp. LPB0316 TaxID=2769490 RepID=UPI0018683C96|nr:sulfurtransferase complex subunit TusB [Thalassotalea sp. LPB0316]QOL25008.1 sulfurtransferase complex subunit TusB [Thalassotalea sp. LPB0316]
MLHIIRQSPFQQDISHELACLLTSHDEVVLIDDGVYFCQCLHLQLLLDKSKTVYLVQEHAQARGISAAKGTLGITFDELSTLILEANKTLTWQT